MSNNSSSITIDEIPITPTHTNLIEPKLLDSLEIGDELWNDTLLTPPMRSKLRPTASSQRLGSIIHNESKSVSLPKSFFPSLNMHSNTIIKQANDNKIKPTYKQLNHSASQLFQKPKHPYTQLKTTRSDLDLRSKSNSHLTKQNILIDTNVNISKELIESPTIGLKLENLQITPTSKIETVKVFDRYSVYLSENDYENHT